jgi:hypothetical protein
MVLTLRKLAAVAVFEADGGVASIFPRATLSETLVIEHT